MKRYQVILIVAVLGLVSVELVFKTNTLQLASANVPDSYFTTRRLKTTSEGTRPTIFRKVILWFKLLRLKFTEWVERRDLGKRYEGPIESMNRKYNQDKDEIKYVYKALRQQARMK